MLRSFFPHSYPATLATALIAGLQTLFLAAGRADDTPAPPKLSVDIDFTGGSAEVLEIDQQARRVRLMPTDHAKKGWRCWWYAKITGATAGETITVEVGDAPWATPDRAALSHDNRAWRQTEPGRREGKRITYQVPCSDGGDVYLAWGPPFVPQAAQTLVEQIARHDFAEPFVLCESRQGRAVPGLRIHDPCDDPQRDAPPYGIWIQARQHAWESGSSWVCRGLIEWLASDDPRAQRLRREAVIHLVPIVDIDSVAIGAGGKNQVPHDHNRDWSDSPHWPETTAAIRQITALNSEKRFDLFIDLHNPGASSTEPFFFIAPRMLLSDRGARNLDRFLASSREDITGPLAFTGRTVESGASYDPAWEQISKNWVAANTRDHVVAVTLETAWNTPASTTAGYQTVGAQLGQAIERYLRFDPRAE